MKKRFSTILLVLILLAGLSLLLYPSFSDWYNRSIQFKIVREYDDLITNMKEDDYKTIIADAEEYNRKVAKRGIRMSLYGEDLEEYFSTLSVMGNGSMGYIEIPKIRATLAIYHGTADDVLRTGVGHIEGSSLPIGGLDTHCILSGHRGLPSARLFTDLDQLVEGDTFTLNVLREILTYEVDQIRTVMPSDLASLTIEPGMDYCTLVTCTPYGVNTHRLLVRGHRIENAVGIIRVSADAVQIDEKLIAVFFVVPILIIFAIISAFSSGKKKKKRKS